MASPSEVPLASQILCVDREIRLREKHYPRWVAKQKLTQRAADAELAAMRAVLQTLLRLHARGEQ